MLELLYHKRNPLIMTILDGSISYKIFTVITREKNLKRRCCFCKGITIMKL